MAKTMSVEEKQIRAVVEIFQIEGTFKKFELIQSGHINSTYKVFVERHGEMKDYIVQRVNTYVFKDPEAVMYNIAGVTEFIRAKIKATGIRPLRRTSPCVSPSRLHSRSTRRLFLTRAALSACLIRVTCWQFCPERPCRSVCRARSFPLRRSNG